MPVEMNEQQLKVVEMTHVEVPESVVTDLVRKAYDLSKPVGMGMIHFQPGPIPEPIVDDLVRLMNKTGYLTMDYTLGRQVKFTILKIGNRYFVHKTWRDHTKEDLVILLASVGVQLS